MRVLWVGTVREEAVMIKSIDALEKRLSVKGIEVVYSDTPVSYPHRRFANDRYRAPLADTLEVAEGSHGPPGAAVRTLNNFWTHVGAVVAALDGRGPVAGVMGFEDGAAVAALLPRVLPLLVPAHPPLRFGVLFSGFILDEPRLRHFYEPRPHLPTLHVVTKAPEEPAPGRARPETQRPARGSAGASPAGAGSASASDPPGASRVPEMHSLALFGASYQGTRELLRSPEWRPHITDDITMQKVVNFVQTHAGAGGQETSYPRLPAAAWPSAAAAAPAAGQRPAKRRRHIKRET